MQEPGLGPALCTCLLRVPCPQALGQRAECGSAIQFIHCSINSHGTSFLLASLPRRDAPWQFVRKDGTFSFFKFTKFLVHQQGGCWSLLSGWSLRKSQGLRSLSIQARYRWGENVFIGWGVYNHGPKAFLLGLMLWCWEVSNFSPQYPEQYWGDTEARKPGEAIK